MSDDLKMAARLAVQDLVETLGRAVSCWGSGELDDVKRALRDLQQKAGNAVEQIDLALGGPAVAISVNGYVVVVPCARTTGARIKYAAEGQASIPCHRDLYRGATKVKNDEVLTVKSGEKFTMRGGL